MDALHAWLDEGRRLLDAPRDDVPDSVLTAIGAAIDRSREAMAAQQDGRPKRRISRAATQTGATLASAFLDPKSLSALAACSRAMKKIARAEALWNAHTAREYPEAATLRTLGGVDALVGQREYARMRRLSNPPLDLFLQPPLGIDGYVALVVMKYGDDIIIPGRLFEITLGADLRVDSFLIDVGAFSPQADGSFLLDGHNVILDDGFKSNEVSVSVSWVRKRDGKCLHLARDATVNYSNLEQADTFVLLDSRSDDSILPLPALLVASTPSFDWASVIDYTDFLPKVCFEEAVLTESPYGDNFLRLSRFAAIGIEWAHPTNNHNFSCRAVLEALHFSKDWA
mmetsp:Transcript_27799/g.91936  ORF Transcript_27799/g.91936 Transcript_27799/m.91936 type:complete len:341 (-) Transcript_27799:15-1037(-)